MLSRLPILWKLAYEAVDHRHSLAAIVSRVPILFMLTFVLSCFSACIMLAKQYYAVSGE